MSTLSFCNPGEIDITLATIFGANVKPASQNPIGHFGTGLKYAIAIVLRTGGSITIHSGLATYSFAVAAQTIRGSELGLITMSCSQGEGVRPLGFTTAVGKNWKPWMAYRELYCNMLDEGGALVEGAVAPKAGHTVILVQSTELWQAHLSREDFIQSSAPIYQTESLSIHPKRTGGFYNKSILVRPQEKLVLFDYNAKGNLTLTEDRTLAESYTMRNLIRLAVVTSHNRILIQRILTAPQDFLEADIDFNYNTTEASNEFWDVLKQLAEDKSIKLHPQHLSLARTKWPELYKTPFVSMNKIEAIQLERATAFLAKLGFPITSLVKVVETLGLGVLGQAENKTILIAKRAFALGTKALAGTLLEEQLHITHGLVDETRDFQNHLLDMVMSLGEQVIGEPL